MLTYLMEGQQSQAQAIQFSGNSRQFLDPKVIDQQTRGLLLTNKKEVVEDVKIKSSFGCSDHEWACEV